MGNYIEEGYKEIEKRHASFFEQTNTCLEQYITIGKKSEKFDPMQLEVLISASLPADIKNEIENLYKPIMQ